MAVRRAAVCLLATMGASLVPVRHAPRASMALPPDAGASLRSSSTTGPSAGGRVSSAAGSTSRKLETLATGAAFDAALGANARCAVLVSAPWCRACRVVAPKFKRLAADFEGRVAFFDVSHPSLNAIAGGSALLDAAEVARDLTVTPMVMLFDKGSRVDVYRAGPTRFKATREKLETWCAGGDPRDVVPPAPKRAAASGRAVDAGSSHPPLAPARRDLLTDVRRRTGRTRASLRRAS